MPSAFCFLANLKYCKISNARIIPYMSYLHFLQKCCSPDSGIISPYGRVTIRPLLLYITSYNFISLHTTLSNGSFALLHNISDIHHSKIFNHIRYLVINFQFSGNPICSNNSVSVILELFLTYLSIKSTRFLLNCKKLSVGSK